MARERGGAEAGEERETGEAGGESGYSLNRRRGMASALHTEAQQGQLIGVIGDEDTVTGFLLAGVGHVDVRRKSNFLIVDSSECIVCAAATFAISLTTHGGKGTHFYALNALTSAAVLSLTINPSCLPATPRASNRNDEEDDRGRVQGDDVARRHRRGAHQPVRG